MHCSLQVARHTHSAPFEQKSVLLVLELSHMQMAISLRVSPPACLSVTAFAGVQDDDESIGKLAEAVYRGVLHALPASARAWFGDLRDRGLSAAVEVTPSCRQ